MIKKNILTYEDKNIFKYINNHIKCFKQFIKIVYDFHIVFIF